MINLPAIKKENIINDVGIISPIGIGLCVCEINKETATRMMECVPNNQRSISKSGLNKIVDSIRLNAWNSSNGEAIKINCHGEIIDGQHRLAAVIKADATITIPIWYNCKKDAIDSIDTGKARTIGDILRMHGYKSANEIASITSSIISYRKSKRVGNRILSVPEAFRFAENNKNELYDAVKIARPIKHYLPISIGGCLAFLYAKTSRIGCEKMFSEFLKPTSRCNSVEMLKNTLMRIRTSKSTQPSYQWLFVISIKAFNRYFIGDDIMSLRYITKEKQPEISDIWID